MTAAPSDHGRLGDPIRCRMLLPLSGTSDRQRNLLGPAADAVDVRTSRPWPTGWGVVAARRYEPLLRMVSRNRGGREAAVAFSATRSTAPTRRAG